MANKNEGDKSKLNEPQPGNGPMRGKKMRVFHSFAEAEAAENYYEAHKDPIQRLRETVQLILRTYGVTQEELNKRRQPLKITLIKYE